MFLNFWYLKSFADEAYHFKKVGNVCIKITSFYQMQSCEIFQNTKNILMLCLDSKLLIVTAQCINFFRANYCTVYLQSPQFMWNRKIFSSMIMPTTVLVPQHCNNKTSTWFIVWEYQWINSVMRKVHSDHNSAVMSPKWMLQNHKITQCQTSHKACITSGGKHKQTAYARFSYCGVKFAAYISTSLEGGPILHFDTRWFKSSGMLCHTEWYTVFIHFTLSIWHIVASQKIWIFTNTICRVLQFCITNENACIIKNCCKPCIRNVTEWLLCNTFKNTTLLLSGDKTDSFHSNHQGQYYKEQMAHLNYVICCILKLKYVIIFQDKYFFLFLIIDYVYSSKIKVPSLSEGKHTVYPLHHQAKNVKKCHVSSHCIYCASCS